MGYAHPLAMSTWDTRFKTGTKPYPDNLGRQKVILAAITAPLSFTSGLAKCVVVKPDKGFPEGLLCIENKCRAWDW